MPDDTLNTMKSYQHSNAQLADTAADSVMNRSAELAALESHLEALTEHYQEMERIGCNAKESADTKLQMARALAGLERGGEAWALGREAFDIFIEKADWESAADVCDVLFQSNQGGSIAALGQGIWLAVTCPIDPELTVELLTHVVDETPDEADGAAVAATTALFVADTRARGKTREDLVFFSTQILANVARRHSGVETQEQFDLWLDRLELREPDKFLIRLRNVVDVLVQDDWWFDRDGLQARLPIN